MSKLEFTSGISTAMVLTIIVLVCARAPVYSKALKAMTPDRMRAIETSLENDRALFVCKYARQSKFQSVHTVLPERKTWQTTKNLQMKDDDLQSLYSVLSANEQCKKGSVNVAAVKRVMNSHAPIGAQ